MDVHFDPSLGGAQAAGARSYTRGATRLVLAYWAISLLVGLPLLWDWISAWHAPRTLANPAMLAGLIGSLVLGQVLYFAVARHDGRPLRWGPTMLFALGNGFCETLAFAVVYRLGFLLGSGLAGLFAPALANNVGFAVGVTFFVVYGGLIHGFFWLRLLPPHLDDQPRSRKIRKVRPLAEIALVFVWSVCLWQFNDIWSIVAFHVLVDLGLMLFVRPPLFSDEG